MESEETPGKNADRMLSISALTLQVAGEPVDAMRMQGADVAIAEDMLHATCRLLSMFFHTLQNHQPFLHRLTSGLHSQRRKMTRQPWIRFGASLKNKAPYA
jgi:hypothetical protein